MNDIQRQPAQVEVDYTDTPASAEQVAGARNSVSALGDWLAAADLSHAVKPDYFIASDGWLPQSEGGAPGIYREDYGTFERPAENEMVLAFEEREIVDDTKDCFVNKRTQHRYEFTKDGDLVVTEIKKSVPHGSFKEDISVTRQATVADVENLLSFVGELPDRLRATQRGSEAAFARPAEPIDTRHPRGFRALLGRLGLRSGLK